ncbi:MAG TPA: element excision factor XisH family protein [Blastocatellia bacterium]|nr:element excision factor XisH family protein [Blastocatellia bacterium]
MPRTDAIHNAVKNALIRDGWTITDDPLTIRRGRLRLYADLAAEHPFAAERDGRRIVVEVKSFAGKSFIKELEGALGQYFIYLAYLEQIDPSRRIYLAISEAVYKRFFLREEIRLVMDRFQVALIAVNLESEVITQWTN